MTTGILSKSITISPFPKESLFLYKSLLKPKITTKEYVVLISQIHIIANQLRKEDGNVCLELKAF